MPSLNSPVHDSSTFARLQEGIARQVFDTLFPIFCLGCETPGDWLCPACASRLPLRLEQRCPLCLRSQTPRGERCFACTDRSALDGLFAASYYQSPLLSLLIHTFKYQFLEPAGAPLGVFLTRALESTDIPLPDRLIPVPLHLKRLRYRGFNQAEFLARYLSLHLLPDCEIPLSCASLARTRATKPQMETRTRAERLANLQQVFAVPQEYAHELRGQNVWLIDDVSTTGTTLNECAKVLKKVGVQSVFGIVLAR